jgi:sodium/potassium-transporting ATPase subunit alpha
MAFWYLQRNGIMFKDITLSFGTIPPGVDQDFYNARVNEASSIYFITLIVMQYFHLLAARTRFLSIFQHPPLFNKETRNPRIFVAMAFAMCVVFFFCYIPWFQNVILTTPIPAEYFFLPVAFGVVLLTYDELRKMMARKYPNGWIAKISW